MLKPAQGEGIAAAMTLYQKVKVQRSQIQAICTHANSCYALAFACHQVPEPHLITKAQTHLIELFNRSIRDNLARFNRRSKRCSKSWEMLHTTRDLFFYQKRYQPSSLIYSI